MTDPAGSRGSHAEHVGRATIQVIFETHATSTDNENGIASGHADPPLSSLGEQQAQQLGLRYTTQRVDAVYCSDLQRSYRTGEIAFATRPTLVTRDARLRECDYGALTHAPRSHIAAEKHRRVRAPFRDGESYEDCARRVREALRDIAHHHPGSTVLVIGTARPNTDWRTGCAASTSSGP